MGGYSGGCTHFSSLELVTNNKIVAALRSWGLNYKTLRIPFLRKKLVVTELHAYAVNILTFYCQNELKTIESNLRSRYDGAQWTPIVRTKTVPSSH